MARLPDKVDFLVNRKFPHAHSLRAIANNIALDGGPTYEERQSATERLKAVEAYEEELRRAPSSQIDALVKEEEDKLAAERKAKRKAEEGKRFFNQPGSEADFSYWARAATWTVEEGLALSFGKDPDFVTWEKLKSITQVSPFAAEYARRKRLVERAVAQRQLTSPLVHAVFLAWLTKMGLSYPPDLGAEVQTYAPRMIEWSVALREVMNSPSRQQSVSLGENPEKTQPTEVASSSVAQSTSAPVPSSEPQAKPLITRERETVLKLIIGMAMGGYGYDPKASRSAAAREIADDLHRVGLSLEPDTVRKWLKEAAELLPGETE